ncbi:glycosyltransferase [Desulfosarcina ovata]|uniref:glycosyltransferase n=1 Tax=Desulfosarcina ovata TaxID=83564 RepID=UPI0013909F17|nr:glycosyltransferase [Desulfosarcina ovata]
MILKVVYFGIYSKGVEYPRNNNLMRALRRNGVDVIEAHFELAGSFLKRMSVVKEPLQALLFFFKLLTSFVCLAWKFIRLPQADVIIVGHPGYFHVHLAWILHRLFRRNSTLVYDVFIPLCEALVADRELIVSGSFFGRLLYRFERSCCRLADLNLIDTDTHGNYLIETFAVDPAKVARVFVGATIAQQAEPYQVAKQKTFSVLFVGTYIPLHGIDVILEAARILADIPHIRFILVGTGQLRPPMELLANKWGLQNVEFIDWISTEQLGPFIRSHDLSLGIFGTTSKTNRVIPSKVFDICAAGVPFITVDSPAIREVFSHGENACLVPSGSPQALAEAIRELERSPTLRNHLAAGARQTGRHMFSLKCIGADFLDHLHCIRKG